MNHTQIGGHVLNRASLAMVGQVALSEDYEQIAADEYNMRYASIQADPH